MAEAQALVERLLASQNPDGGWSYRSGTSWAEPTGFALLALQSQGTAAATPALNRGIWWLLNQQKPSGGWSPNLSVAECTSVTSVATLALLCSAGKKASPNLQKALKWTASQVYPDDYSLSLLLAKALNLPPAHAPGSVPWYPGNAGWVTPTALSTLTLLRAAREGNSPELRSIASQSCSYLLSRRCADSGWNHGGSKTRSEDATSYPETTGLALLALRAAGITPPSQSVALAEKFASLPESTEALSWIQMALQSHTHLVPDPPILPTPRTIRDVSLRVLSLSAQTGPNILLGD